MKAILKKFEIALFVLFACGITWGLKILYTFIKGDGEPLAFNFSLLSQFGPMFSALLVVFIFDGQQGIKRTINSIMVYKEKMKWLLVSAMFEPVVFGVITACYWLSSGNFSVHGGAPVSGSILALFSSFALGILWWGLSEEVGWHGFLLPKLQNRFSPFSASIVLAIVTTIWHYNPNSHGQFFEFRDGLAIWGYYSPMLEQLVISIPVTFVTTYIFNKSGGSLLAMMIFHSASNTSYFWIEGVFHIVHTDFFRAGFLVLFWLIGCIFGFLLLQPKTKSPYNSSNLY